MTGPSKAMKAAFPPKSLVERLARKWDDAFAGQEYPDDDPERHEVAKADVRWFLNAIADELNTSSDDLLEHIGEYDRDVYSGEVAARWLRSQVNPDSAEGEK